MVCITVEFSTAFPWVTAKADRVPCSDEHLLDKLIT